jgi:thiol:disulfide interchange protein
MALGALLLGLRAAGQEVGWAFQLQEPGVVAALLLLAVAITANLLGLFEFAVPGFASSGSPQGAFATGLLAAFVATPCTGPFMAAAMGAALLLPVPAAMALFATLGLGIALPFLAIAFIPALRRRMPRPGKWMVTFRRWMALPMALTAAALLWLASRLGGPEFALACAVLAIGLVAVLWLAGRGQRAGRSVMLVSIAGLAAVALAGFVALPRLEAQPGVAAQGILPSQPFSEAALAEARTSGKPVFAYFTADWCLTCKVNEEAAIERADVRDAFARAGVTVLRGDWTRRDPAITRYLTAQGAAGVPLYMWYPAKGALPQQLPQVLTAGGLVALAAK